MINASLANKGSLDAADLRDADGHKKEDVFAKSAANVNLPNASVKTTAD